MDNIEIIKPSFEIETPLSWIKRYPKLIEKWGKTCYKSEPSSPEKFIKRIIEKKHFSVTEHLPITVKIICSRSCSHQLVRHRIASFSQESQRYVNYKKAGYKVICPENILEPDEVNMKNFRERSDKCTCGCATSRLYNSYVERWLESIRQDIETYEYFLMSGFKPEDARSVLSNAMATTIITTFNLSMWRHVFEERASNPYAQEEIRFIMQEILKKFAELLPCFFEDQLKILEKK